MYRKKNKSPPISHKKTAAAVMLTGGADLGVVSGLTGMAIAWEKKRKKTRALYAIDIDR